MGLQRESKREAALLEAETKLDAMFNGHDGEPGPKTSKGTPYVTMCVGGVKEEGYSYPAWAADIDKAVDMFMSEVCKFASIHASTDGVTLKWRKRPEMKYRYVYDESSASIGTEYTIYARLAFD